MTNTRSLALFAPVDGSLALPLVDGRGTTTLRPLPLRLVDGRSEWPTPAPTRSARRPVRTGLSPEVRRRRTLLAVVGALLIVLALPLSGTGGRSHAAGSALVGSGPATYIVQPGDSLWSIAQRVDPSGDPRPLVARLAAATGAESVVPGEHLTLP